MTAKRQERKSNVQIWKKRVAKKRVLKKSVEKESLLNTLARGVGRAAGTIALATRRIAASGGATVEPGKPGKRSVKSRASAGPGRKRKKAKSAARKQRASSVRTTSASTSA